MIPLGLIAAGAVVVLIAAINPWPSALLIRAVFVQGADATVKEMLPYVPDTAFVEHRDVQYGTGEAGSDTTLDVFSPEGTTEALPTVVWIHGGAWISGRKENVNPYIQIIADAGYTTVSLNYTVSPETIYPTAVKQLNEALGFLLEHASEYNIDPSRIVLAGDSAGANLASQLAVLATSPSYAAEMNITAALMPQQLRGVILNCGIYNVSEIPNAPGIGGWGFRIALWSYFGEKDWSNTEEGDEMSTVDYVTADFPATWISGGNGDPLTDNQSKPLADRLSSLGVDVQSVFYPKNQKPELPHEYQFTLDFDAAQTALSSTISYLDRILK
jgi:acetyl esterase/lipase